MITDLKALKIKAAAYDKLFETPKFGQHSDFTWELHWRTVKRETDERLALASFDVQTLNDDLTRTRMKRLLSTQFVFASRDSVPQIVGRGREILRENTLDVTLPDSVVEAYEFLCEKERELFDTEDEAVVLWKGHNVWNFYSLPDQDGWCARITYYVAHRYDGEVWTDPRHVPRAESNFNPEARAPHARRYVNENQNRFRGIMPTLKEDPK